MKWKRRGDIVITEGSPEVLTDVAAVLDFIMSVRYESGCNAVVAPKELFPEEFYELRTGFAGEVLQKFVNYGVKLALTGDFNAYDSRSFQDFRKECNRGKDFFFVGSCEDACEKLAELL